MWFFQIFANNKLRFPVCLLLIFLLGNPLYAENTENAQTTGTNERNNLNLIMQSLVLENIDFELRPLLRDFGGFGSSVHVRIPGSSGASGTFVLAVPIDSIFAVQTALDLIEIAHSGSDINLLIAFLGNEKTVLNDPRNMHKGLRDLMTVPEMFQTWIVCYLDIDEPPDSLFIQHGSGKYIAALDLIRQLPLLFESHEIDAAFQVRYNELYKLDLTSGSSVLAMLNENHINGISLIADDSGNQNPINSINLANMLLDYFLSIDITEGNHDQHYFIFSLLNKLVFISEFTAMVFLVICMAVFLFIILYHSIVHRPILIVRIRHFFRNCWIFFIILPVNILIIRGSIFFYTFLQSLYSVLISEQTFSIANLISEMADGSGINFFGSMFIMFLAVWLFVIAAHITDILRFARKADFYGVSAIIISVIGLFTAAVLDFTYIAIFLWTFLFAVIGAALKKSFFVFVIAMLIPLYTLGILGNIRELGGLPAHLFTGRNLENWIAIIQIAFISVPIVLLFKRSLALSRKVMKLSHQTKVKVLLLLVGCISIQVMIVAGMDYQTGNNFTEPEYHSIDLTETVFQDSRIYNITLQSETDPLKFNLFLRNENTESAMVFSSPVPFELREPGLMEFILGENPPNPLNLEIVLNRSFQGVFSAEVIYSRITN